MCIKDKLLEIFERLYKYFGPQHWWPGDTAFEICVGAILTQNTNWRNVEKAIKNLKDRGVLSVEGILSLSEEELARLIKPSGFYKQKAKRLMEFTKWLKSVGGLEALQEYSTDRLREELLKIKGIGFETADSILLYALNRPIFVVDSYTYRILLRHNLIEEDADYHQIQSLFMDNLSWDVELFKEYHALLVMTGKNFCKREPLCRGCPLEGV